MSTPCLFCFARPRYSHAGPVPSIVPHWAHKPQCATIWHRGGQVWVFLCNDRKYDEHTSWLTMNSLTYIGNRGQEPFFGHMCSASWMGSTERISSEESSLGTLAFIMQWNKWLSISDHTICLWHCIVGVLNRILGYECSYVVRKTNVLGLGDSICCIMMTTENSCA